MSENTSERPIRASDRPLRFLRMRDLVEMTHLSKSTLYAMHAQGQFPKCVRLSERTTVWVESEVVDWMTARIEASRRDT